jgi:long-subunit fatty acid transport protein
MNATQRILASLALALLMGVLAFAQASNDQATPTSISAFRFNFINPGARATAMGGAFIAQGNDATGSETNPAGLLFIPKPTLHGEYRYFRYTADRAVDASDTEVIRHKFVDSVNSPTFFSLVYPYKGWAFAFYRQELANFEANYSNASFLIPNPPPDTIVWLLNRQSVHLDFNLVNYGFSVAKRLHETFAVGFSVRAAQMNLQGHELADLSQPPPLVELQVSANDGGSIGRYMMVDDSDWKVSFVAGFQYKPNDYFSLGAVYRYGEKHKVQAVFNDNLQVFNYNTGNYDQLVQTYDNFEINVPDRFGVGVSITPTDRWTFNLDYVRINYEDLNDQFLAVLTNSASPDANRYFGWENGNEFHVGGEYLIPIGTANSIALRAGYYAAPDPSIHYLGGADTGPALLYETTFPKLGVDHHATFGVGFVLYGHFQLDLAGDLARDRDNFAVSAMYNF